MAGSDSLERPRFFSGRLLTAEDFALEQTYVREKLRRHNRTLHGFGIISGLRVTTESGKIVIEAGIGLDCEGNELIVGSKQELAASINDWTTAYVDIRYAEIEGAPVVTTSGEEVGSMKESFTIELGKENCNQRHQHVRGRWLACGNCHALTLAKLRRAPQGWRVDRGYRPPAVK